MDPRLGGPAGVLLLPVPSISTCVPSHLFPISVSKHPHPPPFPDTALNLGDSYLKLVVQPALPKPGPLGAPCKKAPPPAPYWGLGSRE